MILPPTLTFRSRTVVLACSLAWAGGASAKVDFAKEVWPLLEKSCVECHRAPYEEAGKVKKPKGGLRLDGAWAILAGGEGGAAVKSGLPDGSPLLARTLLPEDDDEFMPPKGTKWTEAQKALVRTWITEGADFGGWEGNTEGRPQETAPAKAAESWVQGHYERLLQGAAPAPETAQGRVKDAGGRVAPLATESPLLAVDFLVQRDEATDEKIASVSSVKEQVAHLDLSRTLVTDAGLSVVTGMPRLTRLDLHATKIGDAGLKHLTALPNLTYLNLYDTAVTDAGLEAVAALKTLRSVYLWKSQVTEAGVKRLREALPKADVNWK